MRGPWGAGQLPERRPLGIERIGDENRDRAIVRVTVAKIIGWHAYTTERNA